MPKLAVRSPHTHLRHTDQSCPHCAGPLGYAIRATITSYGWQCKECGCKWDVYRNLSKWGPRCPYMTRA